MVPPPGTRDDEPGGGGWLAAAGRFVGFCLLAGAGVALFATVLLLPEYSRLRRAQHELARQQAVNADLADLIAVNHRLIAALPDSRVLTTRLAMRQLGLWPENELVVPTSASVRRVSGLVATTPHRRPEAPSDWIMQAADRVSKPPTRRGLLLLAMASIAVAILLLPAREDRRKKPTVVPGHRDEASWSR